MYTSAPEQSVCTVCADKMFISPSFDYSLRYYHVVVVCTVNAAVSEGCVSSVRCGDRGGTSGYSDVS